jgi:glutathione S-transferase
LDGADQLHFSQIETHLKKSSSGWFAGGEHPTSADYMMSFPLETYFGREGDDVGEGGIREWVKRVQER